MRHHEGSESLRAGDRPLLEREPENPHDSDAVQFQSQSGGSVGYVPRQYSGLVARLLDEGVVLEARAVRTLSVPQGRDRWVVEVARRG